MSQYTILSLLFQGRIGEQDAHQDRFFVRGEYTRGAECPYRQEMPGTGQLPQHNIKNRCYGLLNK